MATNIKLSTIGASAGLNTSTTTVSGSYVATQFLTGSVGAGVRDLPDTPGTLSGTSARPYGQQYEFIEFDGKLPVISIDTLTSPNTSSPNSGKRLDFTYSLSGIRAGESGRIYVWVNGQNTGEYSVVNSGGNGTGFTNSYLDVLNTYIVPNSINTLQLVLTITGTNKTANDSKSVYVYPLDLTIQSISQTPSLTGATSYNYTTGSISFNAAVAGGVIPYIYNWNSGESSVNPFAFNNASTITDKQITLVVTDSHTPTEDTANGTGLPIMRRPISVSVSNASISEPYVSYVLSSTINYNVEPAAITYSWEVGSGTGFMGSSGTTSANPSVYYTTLGSKTHRLNITGTNNASIRNHTTSTTTVQVSPTTNVLVTYTTNSEIWSATFNSVIDATYGTRTYEFQGRSKDAGGDYTAWGNTVTLSTNSISNQAFAGKTNTAQYIQIRVRVRRTFSTFDEVSEWALSNEALVPQKGIINMDNQSNLLTGGNRSFDGNVTIGGVADTGYTTPSITAVSTGGTVTASVTKPSSNIVRVVVNNPCTNVNDGTATHVISLKDGNGYNITKSFTTQYKINTTSINLSVSWFNERYYTNAANSISNNLGQYSFTLSSFAFKIGAGSYTTLNGGTMTSSYVHSYTAPTSDQTWTYRIVASGGTYTASDAAETALTVYGYPGQSYGYSIAGVPSSGTLSQLQNVIARISRNTGVAGSSFAKISVDGYYANRPTGTNVSPAGKSEASIPDGDASFDSAAFSLYDSNECGNNIVGLATLQAILKYAIDASRYYLHLIQAPNIRVSNEPPSLTSTLISGITNDFAIRGNNIIHEISYSTWGPPLAGYYDFYGTFWDNSGYSYLSQNTNPSTFSGITVNGESTPQNTALGYYRISTDGTFCRKTRNVSFGYVPTAAQVGTSITLNYYAREYRITEVATSEGGGFFTYTYNYFFDGSDSTLTSSKTYTVRGRRLNASLCSWNVSIFVNKGITNIELGLGSGTLTGPDGTIDYYNGNLDALTYTFQRYNGTSWVDIGSSYDPGTFGTTKIRVKFTDTWGTVFTSTEQNATTVDLDYTFNLISENTSPIIYAYSGPSQTTAPILANPSALTDYINRAFSTGTSVTVDNLQPNAIVFAAEHDVSGMDSKGTYSNFNGAYTTINVSVTGGSTPQYGMFRTFTYTLSGGTQVKATQDFIGGSQGGLGALTRKQFQMYNSSDTTGNGTLGGAVTGNWRLMAYLRAPSVYGATATYTLHGQKASNNTDQGTDYYIVLRTAPPTNILTFQSESEGCGITTVVFRTGQIDTATTLIIEESTDNSSWSAVSGGTYVGISANTNHSANITVAVNQTKWYRARLTDGSNTLVTRSTDGSGGTLTTFNPGTPPAGTVSLSINCSAVSGAFSAGNVFWKIYTTNSAGSAASYFLLYQGNNDFSNQSVDGYFVVQWYRIVGGCISETRTSEVYFAGCAPGCNNCV